MAKPTFDLLHYIVSRLPGTRYDLASSNLPPVTVDPPDAFDKLEHVEPHLEGSPKLRDQVARISGVPADGVLATAGASEANLLVGLALLEPGDQVVVERPAYEPLWKAFQLLGAGITFLPRPFALGFHPDWEALERLPDDPPRLLVLTNLHNPGGTRLSAEDLARLAEVAETGDFHILMDEIFREAALKEPPPCALTVSDRFIVTSSITKVYGLGGLRLGWCAAAPDLLPGLRQAKDFTSVAPALLSDAIGVRLLAESDAVRRRNQGIMAANRPLVEEWVEAEASVEWVPPEANVSFPRYDGDVDHLASVAFENHGVLIAPGRLFGAPEHFRLCYGTDTETLTAGLQSLSRAMRET